MENSQLDYWVFQRGQRSVREHLPHWHYRLWTDADLAGFMQEQFGNHYERWRALDRPIKRVDTARYALLHHYGGLYADLDFIFTQPIDALLDDEHDLYFYESTQARVQGWEFLGNALMLSTPRHPFWLGVLDHMLGLPGTTAVLQHTGPRALGAYYQSLAVKPAARIFGPEIFDNERCPDGVGEKRYGYHIRTATWQHP